MNKIVTQVIFLLTFLWASTGLAQEITFSFANPTLTGGSPPTTFEFDVMIQGDAGGTFYGDLQVYINYNTLAFGEEVQANGNIVVTAGSGLPGPFYSLTGVNDNSAGTVSIATDYLLDGNTGFAQELTTTPIQILHVALTIDDDSQSSGLDFNDGLMAGQNYQATGTNPEDLYPTVTANDDLDSALPVELNVLEALVEDAQVIVKWSTQSEVNNLGFEVYRSTEENGQFDLVSSYENNIDLEGSGNSNTLREYSYVDAQAAGGATYWYQIADVDFDGIRTFHGPVSVDAPELLPNVFSLHQNYPNPFNPSTTVRYDVPSNLDGRSRISLVIYNSLGMKVKTLYNGYKAPGFYTEVWDGTNDNGVRTASGIYFLRMVADRFVSTKKMVLLK